MSLRARQIILTAAMFFFVVSLSEASIVELGLERCTKPSGKTTSVHECKEVEKKLVNIQAKRLPARSLLTTNAKRKMFRHEIELGRHKVKIGAWKDDPLKAVTVLNISLFEEGRGQVDYNEVSFFDDRDDNYFSIALRPRSNIEFYRLKLKQAEDRPQLRSKELSTPDTF